MIAEPVVLRELIERVQRFAPADGVFATSLSSIHLHRCSFPTLPVYIAQRPCFGLVVQGAKSLSLGSNLHQYGSGDYLVVCVDVPVACRVTSASVNRPHLAVSMSIDPDLLREVIRRMEPSSVWLQKNAPGVSVQAASGELVDATTRLLRLLDQPGDIPAVSPLIEQEILYRLLIGPSGRRLYQIALADSEGNRVSKAIYWLKFNFQEPLRIEALAAHAGMSVTSLHRDFKAVTGMTPMTYQKQLRLHEARHLIFTECLDVAGAGYKVGYQSPSQFSREYKRLYGVSPLQDLSVVRRTGSRSPKR